MKTIVLSGMARASGIRRTVSQAGPTCALRKGESRRLAKQDVSSARGDMPSIWPSHQC